MSARFMLDTDTVSYALRGHGQVAKRILEHQPSQLCVSAITLAELRYGADAKRSKRLRGLVDAFTGAVLPVPFDAAAADRFGAVASALARKGTPIGTFDTLIAAHATALGMILVTNNTQHFGQVPGLKVENWV